MTIYGVVSSTGEHYDVSKTERGAKCFATRNGYTKVSVRHRGGLIAQILAVKSSGKWCKVREQDQ